MQKIKFSLFLLLLCWFAKSGFAQPGTQPGNAILVTDAFFQGDYTIELADKGAWFKFVTVDPQFKGITASTNDTNPMNKVAFMYVYKGSSTSLQQIATASLTTPQDNFIGTFIDTTVASTGDTIFIQLLKSTISPCSGCNNNVPIHYTLTIDKRAGGCTPVQATIDAHLALFGNGTCQLPNDVQPANVCTLRVCANEQICIRFGFLSSSGYPLCAPGMVSIPPAATSSGITVTTVPSGNGYNSNYCFTTALTPGIWLVPVDWYYVQSGPNQCSGEPLPNEPIAEHCHSYMYLEVGPPAPPAMDYTISPNPACVNTTVCFNANNPNLPGYQYYFNGDLLHNTVATSSTTGVNDCVMDYHSIGTFTTSLIVNNGYCQSPATTHTLAIVGPSVTGSYVQNSCRNYTFTANPMCLPGDQTYTWNIAGATYTGSPLTITIPGNAASVPISLSAHSPSLNTTVNWSSTVSTIPVYSAGLTIGSNSCGNITYLASPSACVPGNVIYTWTYMTSGGATITNVGNPITITTAASTTPATTLTVTTPDGQVLLTQSFDPQLVNQSSTLCCGTNMDCVGGRSCTPQTVNSSFPAYAGTQIISNVAFTVLPNQKIRIEAGANITFDHCTFLMYEGSFIELSRAISGLTFNQCYLHGCNKLWEGIHFENFVGGIAVNPPPVAFNNSMIADAVTAFDFSTANDKVALTVGSAVFNKNITAIKMVNRVGTGVTNDPLNQLTVSNTAITCRTYTFTASGFQNGQTTYNTILVNNPPAVPFTKAAFPFFSKSLAGIVLEGAPTATTTVQIGSGGSLNATNNTIYDNLVQGVSAKGLNLNAFAGNKFTNISAPYNLPTLYNTISAGIYFYNKSLVDATNTYATNKVGSPIPLAALRNKFTNCYEGVYAKDEPIDVINADFTDCYNGSYIGNANVPNANNGSTNSTISGNTFVRLKNTGFTMDKNISIRSTINNNNINNATGANFTSRAVDIIEANQPVSARYVVSGNIFNRTWQGTRATQLYNPEFTSNQIILNTDNTTPASVATAPYNTGIHIISCAAPLVNENTINNNFDLNTWWEQGVVSVLSRNGNFYCNHVTGTFSGITTGDNCLGTLMYKNDIHNAKFAHWLIFGNVLGFNYNPMTSSNANPGTAPTFAQPADNMYQNIGVYHSYAQNTTNGQQNARFYVRSFTAGNQFAMTNNGAEGGTSPSVPIATLSPSFPLLPYIPCTGGLPPNGRLMSLAKQVATDALFPAGNSLGKFTSRMQLLSNLQKDNIGTTGDPAIDNFAASISSENVSRLFMVDQLAQQGVESNDTSYFVQANTYNQNLAGPDSIALLQQQVNNVYLDYLKKGGKLDAVGMATLQPIAALCPYLYGSSIWEARAILVGYDNTQYFNACELYTPPSGVLTGARIAQVIDESRSIEEVNNINVYPNPNNGSFKIELPAVSGEVSIEIISTMGSLVKQINYVPSQERDVVEIHDLPQGLYFVVVKANGITIGNNKVIVTK